MTDVFHIAASQPWAIQPEALQTVLTIADRMGDPSALQTRDGMKLEDTRTVVMRDGVAVIPVRGPIFRYANLFTEISGATATGILAKDIRAALDNPYVRGIVLEIDSPGGAAAGISELAEMIHAGRAIKPIVAYGSATMASAAYWLGAAATEIVIDSTALLGSVGVVMSYLDTSERDLKSGVRQVDIVSSRAPDKRMDASTDAGRAKVQTIVDALEDTFIAGIARYRNTTPERVAADFGQGGVRVGADAIAHGMADRIGSLESVIAELAGKASPTSKRKTAMSDQTGQVTVSSTEDLRKALAAGYTAEQISIDSTASTAVIQAARAEGEEAGRAAGAAAERHRIAGIHALARRGFEAELKVAIDAGDSPEKFAMALLTAAKDRGVTLDAIDRDAPPAAAHAGAPSDAAPPASWDAAVTKLGGK